MSVTPERVGEIRPNPIDAGDESIALAASAPARNPIFKGKRKFLLILPTVMASMLSFFYYQSHHNPYSSVRPEPGSVPRFHEAKLPFVHRFDAAQSLPVLASAVIDVDGDGVPEVFLGGGAGQPDGLFAFRNGQFVDIGAGSGLTKGAGDATYGAAVTDVNGDGRPDLFVARDSGVYLYVNEGGRFQGRRLDIPFNAKSTPISIALTDLNGDGKVDMFVSCYIPKKKMEGQNIFNKKGYGATSLLLLNNGDDTFKDITREAGLEYVHNTFQAVFADVDGDGRPDLVVAYDTGQVRTYRNLGNLKFENAPNPMSDRYGYPMGIAAGDYDNDGRIDFFFSNVGYSAPAFMAKGDLRKDQVYHPKWILFHNDGNFKFTDTAKEARLADYDFSWGAVFKDFNLDGLLDLAVAESYVGLPPHKLFPLPGRLLIQKADHTFAAAEKEAGVENRHYGVSPLVADFNGDGYPDIVMANLKGPAKAFINDGGKNNFLTVRLPDTPRSLGAVVTVETKSAKRYVSHFIQGEGLASDQTHLLTFGLGRERELKSVSVKYLTGETRTLAQPTINSTVVF